MSFNRLITFYSLFIINIFSGDLISQCEFSDKLTIHDDSTAVYAINISGSVNSNLDSNGICGILMKFKHTIIGDVRVELISPYGQSVTLLGPTAPLSNLTSFTTWDISFTPCSFSASPDFGFASIWNNLQPWGQFGNYNGTYYPFNGCLEDFNQGSINGTWTLIVDDVNRFDTGIIESFQIIFCDDMGINCEECEPKAGQINNSDLIACKGDSLLDFTLDLSFENGQSNQLDYTNEFVVFNENEIFEYSANPNVRFYPSGIYTICNIDYKSNQLNLLPLSGIQTTYLEYDSLLRASGTCAMFGDSCMTIEIVEPAAIVNSFEEICLGDSILFFDLYFKEEGIYSISRSGGLCDTIFVLNLDVIDMNPTIISSKLGLNCINDNLILTVIHDEIDKPIEYNWYTLNGNIITNPINQNINVDEVGLYYVETSYNGCTQLDSFEVMYSEMLPELTLSADTVDCIGAEATVTITSNKILINRDWSGPEILAEGILTIKVGKPGIYKVIATDIDGCVQMDSIEVIGDIDPPQLTFDVSNINCKSDTASITILGKGVNDTITWLNLPTIEIDTFAYVSNPGAIFIESIGPNQCKQIDTIIIIDESYNLFVDVLNDTITCNNMTLTPTIFIADSMGQVTYYWDFLGTQFSLLPNPLLISGGLYSVEIQDTNECVGFATFEITEITSPPNLLVNDTIFTCIDDSIQIQILNPEVGFQYIWSGPFDFLSFDSTPYIYHTGNYIVKVTDRFGCTNTAQITVIEGADLPSSAFNVTKLDCFNDTAYILPQTTNGLTFNWQGDGLVSDTVDANAVIISEGYYYLTITDMMNCQNTYEFQIEDERSYLSVDIMVDSLDCVTDTVRPSFILSDLFIAVNWIGPESFIDTSADITIPGKYYLEFVGTNGCITNDSINVVFDNTLPIIDIEQNPIICEPDSALQLIISPGAIEYIWKNGGIILANSDSLYVKSEGNYNAIVVNYNGCVDSMLINVQKDTLPPDITLSIDNIINCEDSLSTISAGPIDLNINYNWSGPEILVNNVNSIDVNGQGKYFLVTTNLQGCSSIDSIDVQDSRIEPNFNTLSGDISCYSTGFIHLSDLTNVDSLVWTGPQLIQDGTEEIEVTLPGNYTITAYSVLGCEKFISIDIVVDTMIPEISEFFNDTINCFNPIVNIGFDFIEPIDSITWDGPINFVSLDTFALIEQAGVYNISIYGENGCVLIQEIEIIEDVDQPIASIQGDTLTCLRSKVLLTIDNYTNVNQINWIGPGINEVSDDLFINQPGLYIANIQGENGCIYIDSINIIEDKQKPLITIQDTFYLPCNGDSVTLFINSTDNIEYFRWVGTGFFSDKAAPNVINPQTIYLYAAGSNGCNSYDSTKVVEDLRPIEFDLLFDSITCAQPFANLTALDVEDDESFYWVKPNNMRLNAQNAVTDLDGVHKLIVNRGNNCIDSVLFTVKIDTIAPIVNVAYNDFYQCENKIVAIEGDIMATRDNYTYRWETNNGRFESNINSLTPLVNLPGIYTLTATDTLNGCKNSKAILVEKLPQFFLQINLEIFDPLCLGEASGLVNILDLEGAVGDTEVFFEGTLLESFAIDSLSSGDYYIKGVDSFGCIVDTVVTIGDGFYYNIEITGDTIVELGDSVLLQFENNKSGIFYDSIYWYTKDSVLCADCDEISPYIYENTYVILQTITEDGCIAIDSILIRVDADVSFDFPTAFSPDGNNINDVFKVPALKEFERLERVMIFDRWGTVMHQEYNKDINDQVGWDGTYNGEYALPGVYAVLMDIRLKNGLIVKKSTDLTLIR